MNERTASQFARNLMEANRVAISEEQARALAHILIAEGRADLLNDVQRKAMSELQEPVAGGLRLPFDEAVEWTRAFWRKVSGGELAVDEKPVCVMLTALDAWRVIIPLAARAVASAPTGKRGFLGIAGPPGSGKSVLAALMVKALKIIGGADAINLPMDGYHFPNEILETHFAPGPTGTLVRLIELKGIPETFDSPRLAQDLQKLRQAGTQAKLPAYSRLKHDPVLDAITVDEKTRWIVTEGNFLLLDEGRWAQIREMLDLVIGLDASDELLRFRLMQRFERAGRDPAWIQRHWQWVDGPNAIRARRSLARADVVLDVGLNWSLSPRLTWREHAGR